MQRLIYDGLAENVPHHGAIVSDIKPDDFRGLLVVRQPLEGLAARLATLRATDEDLRSLRELLNEHARVVDSGDEAANAELDTRFHAVIRDMAGNHDLSAILGPFRAERTCPSTLCGEAGGTPWRLPRGAREAVFVRDGRPRCRGSRGSGTAAHLGASPREGRRDDSHHAATEAVSDLVQR